MDKKTIIVLSVLMTLFCMQGYAQMFSDTLCWKQKDEAAIELYNYMSGIVCDNAPIVVNSGGSLFGFGEKKRIKKERALQRQLLQNKMKAYMENNFVIVNDSVKSFRFCNKNQVIEWGKSLVFSPFTSTEVYPTELSVKDSNILILMTCYGSGIIRMRYYVFRDSGRHWELQTASEEILFNKVDIKTDDEHGIILFDTPTGQIGKINLSDVE